LVINKESQVMRTNCVKKSTLLAPLIIFLFGFYASFNLAHSGEVREGAEPSLALGSQVFKNRCVLCHGSQGMGEGALALKLKDYPSTNLMTNMSSLKRADIHNAVAFGGSKGSMSNFMPPMGNDLSWTELESVVDFVLLLRTNNTVAKKMLLAHEVDVKASRKVGAQVYNNRCVLCHGSFGEGDGRMARVIKSPPPANLMRSRLPDDYLVNIITKGGAGMGRSPQMPPWGDQLSPNEIRSVIFYIKHLRE
jgi:mono/diheme cytochrome c family protein